MRATRTQNLLATALACALAVTSVHAQQQTQAVETRSGKLELNLGLPIRNTVKKLYDEIDYQRTVQAYLWCERDRTIWKEERGQA